MTSERRYREALIDSRRIVVKIGSRVIVQKSGRPDLRQLERISRQIIELRAKGYDVVVVSSGAIGAGMEALNIVQRPKTVPELQMCAAVGQTRLMNHYADLFSRRKIKVGQVLLTHSDFRHRVRLSNARRTMEHLLRGGVIPIINENDVVADEEVKADLAFGDNDYLAALVVKLVRADLLVLLSTVDGLREPTSHGRTRRVRTVETISAKILSLARPNEGLSLSKGGMESKLKAAQMAVRIGCNVVIANGRSSRTSLPEIVMGQDQGTLILASGT